LGIIRVNLDIIEYADKVFSIHQVLEKNESVMGFIDFEKAYD
jgi:hypothetical protein